MLLESRHFEGFDENTEFDENTGEFTIYEKNVSFRQFAESTLIRKVIFKSLPSSQDISIGTKSFQSCIHLNTLHISKNIREIKGGAFSCCFRLENIIFEPRDNNKKLIIGRNAFYHTAFTNLVIPDFVQSIGNYAFANSHNLKSLSIPRSIRTIHSHAFIHAISLTSIIFNDHGKHDKHDTTTIESMAFLGASSLQSIIIPLHIYIDRRAFAECRRLTYVKAPRIFLSPISYQYIFDVSPAQIKCVVYYGEDDNWERRSKVAIFIDSVKKYPYRELGVGSNPASIITFFNRRWAKHISSFI